MADSDTFKLAEILLIFIGITVILKGFCEKIQVFSKIYSKKKNKNTIVIIKAPFSPLIILIGLLVGFWNVRNSYFKSPIEVLQEMNPVILFFYILLFKH